MKGIIAVKKSNGIWNFYDMKSKKMIAKSTKWEKEKK